MDRNHTEIHGGDLWPLVESICGTPSQWHCRQWAKSLLSCCRIAFLSFPEMGKWACLWHLQYIHLFPDGEAEITIALCWALKLQLGYCLVQRPCFLINLSGMEVRLVQIGCCGMVLRVLAWRIELQFGRSSKYSFLWTLIVFLSWKSSPPLLILCGELSWVFGLQMTNEQNWTNCILSTCHLLALVDWFSAGHRSSCVCWAVIFFFEAWWNVQINSVLYFELIGCWILYQFLFNQSGQRCQSLHGC